MLKAIGKFILERVRGVRPRPSQVVEEEGSGLPPSNSDVPPGFAEPQAESSSGLLVRGQVKWFNPNKGYGFVQLSDGTGDVFLHAGVLVGLGLRAVRPGETLELRVMQGQRGPQVSQIISVDSSTAAPLGPARASFRSPPDRTPVTASIEEAGTVKWYSAARGFGFIVRDGGGKDVFVHASALQRAGVTGLSEGQRVVVGIAEGRKGPEAVSIRMA